MQVLTAAILAGFVGYAGAWYLGHLEGNFALLLFLATMVTGLYWIAERAWEGEMGPANDTAIGLHFALRTQFRMATPEERLSVLR